MDKTQLMADLTDEEGYRSLLYDDRTGKPLRTGMVIQGNPTFAIGWNVAARPCPPDLAQIILGYFVDQTWATLLQDHPWVGNIPDPCQRALCDMAFNNGESGLDGFNVFLSLVQQGNYEAAASDLEGTLWFGQVGTRGPKIAALIRQGASTS